MNFYYFDINDISNNMNKKKFIIFGTPSIGKDEINAVKKVMASKWIGSGPITEKFAKYKKKFSILME